MDKKESVSGTDVVKEIAQRVKEVLLKPRDTFAVIKAETVTSRDLIFNYLAPLAVIPAVASIIGLSAVGIRISVMGTFRIPLINSLSSAVLQYILTLIGIYILGIIINALAPSFSGKKNEIQALKVAVYSATPSLVAGILYIFPVLGILVVIAGLYGLYLLYLAIPTMMECPPEKALGYTMVIVIINIVIFLIIGVLVSFIPLGMGLGLLG
ncbi:hypothetical protein LCGC14_2068230 [marine sediment metagenome]|uniref:Yip1 domain-containing protein n=1 Tax=marine sediment metagenome TaxID=412755 RepID=A0A0F9GXM9_9ZZZZ